MRILALEPYYGGSHQAFLDGWTAASRHEWTVLHLPAYKWKWRMRHSAVTFADEVRRLVDEGRSWEVIFCSDMLNLAEFLGLAPRPVQEWPAIAYFHENQLTYPVRFESERDYQFAMTNMTSAIAARRVWFNSAFHRDSFLEALATFLRKMPDYQPTDVIERIRDKTEIFAPGVNAIRRRGDREAGPARILWAARWEHDKNPEDFFEALKILKSRGVQFRISVIGERFRDAPETFEWARHDFAEHIDRWGYQESRKEYEDALVQADILVSTAKHEFFGVTAVEAILAGAYPVLPKRLAYPEILGLGDDKSADEFFYDGSVTDLANKLAALAERVSKGCLWTEDTRRVVRSMERFRWDNLVDTLDEAVDKACFNH
jgi:glycosyltransferase involved in cell wall biosynthesis